MIHSSRRDSNPQPSDRQADDQKSQSILNAEVTRVAQSDLAEIRGQFPDIEVVIKTWRFLPEHIKAAIKTLIETLSRS